MQISDSWRLSWKLHSEICLHDYFQWIFVDCKTLNVNSRVHTQALFSSRERASVVQLLFCNNHFCLGSQRSILNKQLYLNKHIMTLTRVCSKLDSKFCGNEEILSGIST